MASKPVSLRDIAKYCNVSATTVSCVVRKVDCVKEATRIKVEAAIEKLGYKADPALRALAAYRTSAANHNTEHYKSTIAFLDSEPSEFAQAMFEECRREGRQLGYELKYFKFPSTHREQELLSKRLWAQGIRGILLGPARQEFDLDGFQFDRFAVVGIGAFQHHPAVDAVSADYFQGLYLAAQQCYEKGYRRIGLFLPAFLEARTGHRWLGAYYAFCHHYRQEPLPWIVDGLSFPSDEETRRWVKENRIDALLTLERFASPSLTHLYHVSLNDWHVVPGMDCISTPQCLIAQKSVRLLDDHLIHRRYGAPESPRQILVKPTFRPCLSRQPA